MQHLKRRLDKLEARATPPKPEQKLIVLWGEVVDPPGAELPKGSSVIWPTKRVKDDERS